MAAVESRDDRPEKDRPRRALESPPHVRNRRLRRATARSRRSSSTGLQKLEYRGYDSAGISILAEGAASTRCAPSATSRPARRASSDEPRAAAPSRSPRAPATTGIGHTRWATHGRVTEDNAHPHYDNDDRVHVVVNGIVENYMALKQRAHRRRAPSFTSETDAEVIAHLISRALDGRRLVEAVRARLRRACAATTRSSPSPPTSPSCSSARARSAR